jgi:enoyl-CoA hydratase/carnithine racemase
MEDALMQPAVLVERRGGTLLLTLNRPDRLNALSLELVQAFEAALTAAAADPSWRVCLLAAAGDKGFCAGADLKERATMSEEQVRQFVPRLQALASQLSSLDRPTIALVQGAALGGGLELALACDLRIAAEEATLGLTEVQLGIIPGAGGTQRLTRLVGVAKAKELIFMARRLTGAEAVAEGVANAVVPRAALLETGLAWAERIALGAPLAIIAAKRAIDEGAALPLAEGLAVERICYAPLVETTDRVEALTAFREKRPPRFEGR